VFFFCFIYGYIAACLGVWKGFFDGEMGILNNHAIQKIFFKLRFWDFMDVYVFMLYQNNRKKL